jgi:hypothetical protein
MYLFVIPSKLKRKKKKTPKRTHTFLSHSKYSYLRLICLSPTTISRKKKKKKRTKARNNHAKPILQNEQKRVNKVGEKCVCVCECVGVWVSGSAK